MLLKRPLYQTFGDADFVSAITLLLLSFPLLYYPNASWAIFPLAVAWAGLFLWGHSLHAVFANRFGIAGAPAFPAATLCCVMMCCVIAAFLKNFPAAQWHSVIFVDDYAPGYAASIKGLGALFQGGLFGWDSRVLGGYFMASEVPMNRALFLLPFAALCGPQAGYHMMVFFFYCAFPVLSFAYARSIGCGRGASTGAFFFAGVFLIGFLRGILHYGMIDVLMGLDFFILNLVLFERLKAGRNMAAFYLSISIAASMYAHITFFLCSIIVFAVELIRVRSKSLAIKTFIVLVFSFFMTLWQVFYFIYYHRYFITNPELFDPSSLTLAGQIVSTVKSIAQEFNPVHPYWWNAEPQALAMSLACVLAYCAITFGQPFRRLVGFIGIFVFLCCLQFQASAIVTSRAMYCVQFFLIIILGKFTAQQFNERRFHNIIIALFLMTPIFSPSTYRSADHIKSIREQWPDFYNTVSGFDGNMVLLENIAHWDLTPDTLATPRYKPVDAHWESLVSYEAGQRLFCTTMEGYHYSIYRGNAINSGTFRGKRIDRYDPAEIAKVILKWGIRYLVVWSDDSKKFLTEAPSLFRSVKSVNGWYVFQFLKADPRTVVMQRGRGVCEDFDYFAKRLYLSDAVRGDTVTIRQNYFPSWKAWQGGKQVPVFNRDGQLAILAPVCGKSAIDLTFPKYPLFSAAAVLSMAASLAWFGRGAWKSRRRKFQ